MISVVSLVVESGSSSMLVFEYFCQNSFSVTWLSVDGLAISLDAHSSSMNGVELILDVVRCSGWSLAASSSGWMRCVVTLSDWWSWDLNLSSWSWYQVLSLVAAWLEHKTLVLFWRGWHIVLDGSSVDWLPRVLWPRWHLSILYHSVDDLLIISTFISLGVLLVDKSHWKLADINRVVWILHDHTVLLLFLLVRVLRLLNWSESATRHLVAVSSSLINGVSGARWYAHWLTSGLDVSFSYILGLNWLMNCLEHSSTIVAWTTIVGCSCWEESLFSRWVLILSSVEVLLGWVLSTSGTSSNTGDMSSICSITVFSFHRLDHGIIQIYNQIIIDSILIWWFWLSNLVALLANSLRPSVESSNSLIWWSVLLLLLFIDGSMLDSLVVERVVSRFLNSSNWGAHEFVDDFPTIFDLFGVEGCRHVEVLLVLGYHIWVWWVVCVSSILAYNFGLVEIIIWNVSA